MAAQGEHDVDATVIGAGVAGIAMLHDVAGLSAGIRGMARSVANSGYAVVVPDFLSVQGGTAGFRGNDAEVQKAVAAATAATVGQQLTAALGYVKTHGGGGGKGLGLIGYGWGGTQTLLYAAGRQDLAACVAFCHMTIGQYGKSCPDAVSAQANGPPATMPAPTMSLEWASSICPAM